MDEASRGPFSGALSGRTSEEEAATSIEGLARLIGQSRPLRESGRLRLALEKQIGNAEAEA